MQYDPHRRLVILAEGYFGHRAKTAEGVIRYGKNPVVAVIDSTHVGKTVDEVIGVGEGIPFVRSVTESLTYGPDALLIGIATQGGYLPEEWRAEILTALEHGLDVINGLHVFLSEDPEISRVAEEHGCELWDVRRPPEGNPIGLGLAADVSAQVVLTVGTDCDVGKMTAALEIARGAERTARKVAFLATGQTGIMISGFGVPVDRVIGDFMAGCMEQLVIEWAKDHDLLLVEGQGSLYHPGYSGVTLALMHGSAPSHMILCHDVRRKVIGDDTRVVIPPLREVVQMYEYMAAPVRPARVVGIALKCLGLSDEEARRAVEWAERETGLPATDCIRFGPEKLVTAVNEAKG